MKLRLLCLSQEFVTWFDRLYSELQRRQKAVRRLVYYNAIDEIIAAEVQRVQKAAKNEDVFQQ